MKGISLAKVFRRYFLNNTQNGSVIAAVGFIFFFSSFALYHSSPILAGLAFYSSLVITPIGFIPIVLATRKAIRAEKQRRQATQDTKYDGFLKSREFVVPLAFIALVTFALPYFFGHVTVVESIAISVCWIVFVWGLGWLWANYPDSEYLDYVADNENNKNPNA